MESCFKITIRTNITKRSTPKKYLKNTLDRLISNADYFWSYLINFGERNQNKKENIRNNYLTTCSVKASIAGEYQVGQSRMEFTEFSRLRRRPTTLTSQQLSVVFFRVRLDVEQELDQVPERVQPEQLLTLTDTLQKC